MLDKLLVSTEIVGILTWFMLPLVMLTLGYAAIMTLSLFIPLLIPVAALAAIPLGFDFTSIMVFYDVSVESLPTGEWKVTQVAPEGDHDLNHSFLYEDPKAIALIVKWISGISSA